MSEPLTASRAMTRQLSTHVQPPLWTAAPGRWQWSDGCAVTVEHIHGEYNATTLYHPGRDHQPSSEKPVRELQVTP